MGERARSKPRADTPSRKGFGGQVSSVRVAGNLNQRFTAASAFTFTAISEYTNVYGKKLGVPVSQISEICLTSPTDGAVSSTCARLPYGVFRKPRPCMTPYLQPPQRSAPLARVLLVSLNSVEPWPHPGPIFLALVMGNLKAG